MAKILITGRGFVSQNLQRKLYGHEIFVYTREDSPADILDFQPQIIFHTAADLYDIERMFDSNVKLTYDLLEITKDLNYQSFVYIGSSSEYGRVDGPMNETMPISPRTMYEATKGCGSLLCQAYAKIYNKPIIIARPFSLYGRYDVERKLIPTLYRCFSQNTKARLVEESVHDWIYIDDFIRGIIAIAFAPKGADIVNFGSGVQTTNLQVVRILEKIFGKSLEYEAIAGIREFDTTISWVCDTSYAKEKYGFECRYSLERGLSRYVDEHHAT
jgi:nucleoside-diphosphate-sugar epimerase